MKKIDTEVINKLYDNYDKQSLYERIRQLKNELGYKSIFDFSGDRLIYSWKHTGVVEAFKAGIKPYNIMKQTGHRNRQSFEVYLKSLGLEENSDFLNNMPDLF